MRRHLVFLLLTGLVWTANSPATEAPLSGTTLVEALHRGGYNLYFRHAATDWSRSDQVAAEGDWTSCDPQKMRQLSAQGRAAAKRVGEAIRRLGIPVGRVFASEYCRARDTAEHLGLGPVTPIRAVMNMRAAAFVGGPDAVVERARQALSAPPPHGANNVFVAHGNLMRAVTGAYTGEGGAVVLAPRGQGRFHVVAQLDPEDWDRLANRQATPEIPP